MTLLSGTCSDLLGKCQQPRSYRPVRRQEALVDPDLRHTGCLPWRKEKRIALRACSSWPRCTSRRYVHTRTSLCSAAYSICAWDVNHLARPSLLRRPVNTPLSLWSQQRTCCILHCRLQVSTVAHTHVDVWTLNGRRHQPLRSHRR